jgi:inhibitor of cysteine peptidase
MPEILVTQGYNGTVISANIGDTLTIELPENPGTGYRWTPASVDANLLLLTGDEFQLGTQSAVGGGGKRVFRFVAKDQGTTQIQCTLARSWEASGLAKDTFRILVKLS